MYNIMNTNNHVNKLFSSFFSIVLFIALMAGCASVTDANLDSQTAEEPSTEVSETKKDNDSDDEEIWYNTNGDDMDPIVDQPPSPRGN